MTGRWIVRWDQERIDLRGVCHGWHRRIFGDELEARRFFARLCAAGTPATEAAIWPESFSEKAV